MRSLMLPGSGHPIPRIAPCKPCCLLPLASCCLKSETCWCRPHKDHAAFLTCAAPLPLFPSAYHRLSHSSPGPRWRLPGSVCSFPHISRRQFCTRQPWPTPVQHRLWAWRQPATGSPGPSWHLPECRGAPWCPSVHSTDCRLHPCPTGTCRVVGQVICWQDFICCHELRQAYCKVVHQLSSLPTSGAHVAAWTAPAAACTAQEGNPAGRCWLPGLHIPAPAQLPCTRTR